MTSKPVKTAEIIGSAPNPSEPGSVLVWCLCPRKKCDPPGSRGSKPRVHLHGVPGPVDVADSYGERGAHCRDGRGGVYLLTDPGGLVAAALAGRTVGEPARKWARS